MPTNETKSVVTIKVDAGQSQQQLKVIADSMGGLTQSTKSLAESFGFLKSGAASFLGGLSIRQLADFSDQIQTLNNRLLAITGNQDKATQLLAQLGQASRDTNTSLADTADLFAKMSLALKDANINSSVLIDFTKTLTNTFRLSGTTSEEAASKVTSLAYALQQGGLKGRELRTVLRDNTVLAQLFKSEFNGNILEAANNGFITTAKFLEIIHKNMGDVNSRAEELSATFGQSLTKVFDSFKVKIFQLNTALGASEGFVFIAQFVIDHMSTIIALFSVLAVTTIPLLITQVYRLATAFGILSEPVIIITALGAALLSTNEAMLSSLGPLDQLNIAMYRFDLTVTGTINKIAYFGTFLPGVFGKLATLIKTLTDADLANSHKHIDLLVNKATDLTKQQEAATKAATASADQWKKAIQGAGNIKLDKSPAEILAALNAEFVSGAISVEDYNEKIQQVDLARARKEFNTGHADLKKLNEEFDKFNTYKFNTQLRDGTITFSEFDTAIRNAQLEKLNRELAAGSISLEEYNTKLASVQDKFSANGAFRTGLQDYLNAIGTTTQQVANTITNAFKNVEDSFVNFVKTGKFNFDKFTQDILDDLLRIIIRASIISPLAQGILGAISYTAPANAVPTTPGGGQSYAAPNAHGNIYNRGLTAFASGGVVSTPTMFGFKSGVGLMGEAGPEAILPLKRGSGGDLGVKASVTPVNINIINNNQSSVEQKETTGPNGEKTIDILITDRVRKGIANGSFDKTMKSSFGLNRKGS